MGSDLICKIALIEALSIKIENIMDELQDKTRTEMQKQWSLRKAVGLAVALTIVLEFPEVER